MALPGKMVPETTTGIFDLAPEIPKPAYNCLVACKNSRPFPVLTARGN
jgi:hypothetical protein